MEFITELAWKMTINNLFDLNPSTDFSYAWIIFWILIGMILFAAIFDFISKNQSNKFLKKALRSRMWHIRWTFPLVWIFLLIMRIEWIPFLNMKFLFIVFFLAFLIHFVCTFFAIKKDYSKRVEKQIRYSKN